MALVNVCGHSPPDMQSFASPRGFVAELERRAHYIALVLASVKSSEGGLLKDACEVKTLAPNTTGKRVALTPFLPTCLPQCLESPKIAYSSTDLVPPHI